MEYSTCVYKYLTSAKDHIISLNTGRIPSLSKDMFGISLPSDTDFHSDISRHTIPDAMIESIEPIPFKYLVHLMIICGSIATVLDDKRGRWRTPGALDESRRELVRFYADLPGSLKWGTEKLKHQMARGHGVSIGAR